jgi:hypothetical protein
LYEILKEAEYKNIQVLSEEKTFIYKHEQEWWDKLWTHGYIEILEMILEDEMKDFKGEVFERRRELKDAKNIATTMSVLYAYGEKYTDL